MKNIYSRYARTILTLMVGVAMMTGCVNDDAGSGIKKPAEGDGSLTLSIAMPEPTQKNMTRSIHDNYNTIQDLNIIIADGKDNDATIRLIYYIDPTPDPSSDYEDPQGYNLIDFSWDGVNCNIHFTKEWMEYFSSLYGIDPSTCAFFVVTNWGNEIGHDTDRIKVGDTVEQLRAVKVERRDWTMFGESVDLGVGHNHADGVYGRSLEVKLERLVAMFTVEIVGLNGLNDGVEIMPISVSLHNVPAYGTLDSLNILTGNDRITPLASAISPNGQSVTMSGSITRGGSVGGHYDNPNLVWKDDPAVDNIRPLFMYENYHGEDFGEGQDDDGVDTPQQYKRPSSAIQAVSYSDDSPSKDEIEAVSGACSYLKVDARYRNTSTGEYGTVTYRLFLGGDIIEDFNVMRNTYYRVTLQLSGTAISETDYSWRMDSNLSNYEIIGESDIIVNGGGKSVLIQLPDEGANNGNAQYVLEIDGANPGFVWLRRSNGWQTLQAAVNDKSKMPSIGNNPYTFQFDFFIEPMIPGVTWNGPGNMRQVKFRIHPMTAGANQGTEWITITQYAPFVITIEDDYSSIQDEEQRKKMEAIRDYARDELGWDLPKTFFLDRADNKAQPWGFENRQIDENQTSGLLNVNTLRAYGAAYLPEGNGSAMMHAGVMRYYQRQPTPNNFTMAALTNINAIASHNPPDNYPNEFFIPSVNEWRLIEMLLEADVEMEDPISPIVWNNYWTSDAVTTDGSRESYVYRMGNPEFEIDRRGSSLRTEDLHYRMMYWVVD